MPVVSAVSRTAEKKPLRSMRPSRNEIRIAPNAPTPAASVGEKKPTYMPPSTTPKRSSTGQTPSSASRRSSRAARGAAGPCAGWRQVV